MRVNWSERALAELDGIADYIEQDNPDAAELVATRIVDQIFVFNGRSWDTRSSPRHS